MSSHRDRPSDATAEASDEPLVRPADDAAAAPAGADQGASAGAPGTAVGTRGAKPRGRHRDRPESPNMLPPRERRRFGLERILVRLVATAGIVGIGVAIAAIMTSSHSQGWLIGAVVSVVTVILAAILWSSRQL